MFLLSQSASYQSLLVFFPGEIANLIFACWLGDCVKGDAYPTNPPILAYQFAWCNFPEGLTWVITRYSFDATIMNQILYGASVSTNLELSLYILEHGAEDLATGVNLALGRGDLDFIRALLFWREEPEIPFSMYRWLRFCRKL
jgi:hypothetical protein